MANINNYTNEMYNCKNGAWFDVLYTYKYGDEYWDIDDDCKTIIYADSSDDAIMRFFAGDEKQNIKKKSDDFCNRVLSIHAYAR